MPPKVIAVLSNKGGVGKTHIATNLAIGLARRGKRVLVIDADWSSANVALKLGLSPKATFGDYFRGKCGVNDLIMRAPFASNLYFVAGSLGDYEVANMDPEGQVRTLSIFQRIAERSKGDYILLDAGAGIEARTLDTALTADLPLVITTPQDVLSGYGCLKALLQRFLLHLESPPDWFESGHFHPALLVNQVLKPGQGDNVAQTMRSLLRDHAGQRAWNSTARHSTLEQGLSTREAIWSSTPISKPALTMAGFAQATVNNAIETACDLQYFGEIPYAHESFIQAEMRRIPFVLASPTHPAAVAIGRLADRIIGQAAPIQVAPVQPVQTFWQRLTHAVAA